MAVGKREHNAAYQQADQRRSRPTDPSALTAQSSVREFSITMGFEPMAFMAAASLTVTSKGQLTLRKELLQHLGIQPGQRVDVEVLPGGRLELHAERATAEISGFIGLLAGRTSKTASLEELTEAAAAGWAAQ